MTTRDWSCASCDHGDDWAAGLPEEQRLAIVVGALFDECLRRGALPIAEVERRARERGVIAEDVLYELGVTEGFEVDRRAGVVRCRR
jgi:hypothetical protein